LTLGSEPLRAGIAETVITPPNGFPMAGYYHERLATGSRDPLKARAVVFRQGDRAAAFVVADLTGIARDLCVQVRERAAARTGIPARHMVVSATHSHTAPDYTRHFYEYLATEESRRKSDSYAARLLESLAGAIEAADGAVQPVSIRAGSGEQELPVSFNRRFVMNDGSVRTWQRFSNPAVIRAAGPIDPEIGLLEIRSLRSESTLGVVSNFALHLDTVGGNRWSADFPYYIEQSLREKYGKDVVSVFATGACGDINHSDPTRRDRNSTDMIGEALAATIQDTLPALEGVESPLLQMRTTTVRLPLQDVTRSQLARAQVLIPTATAGGKVDFFDLVGAYKAVMLDQLRHETPIADSPKLLSWGLSHEWKGVGDELPAEVTVMTLGDEVALVFLPGEVFVELGLAIKRGSPYRTTLVIELSNCVETVYIPTRGAYAGGGYEVANSTLRPGSGEILVETALSLLRETATHSLPAGTSTAP
jgi:hypothetical protein